MDFKRRLEKLEARTTGAETRETPVDVRVYLKAIENERRKQAREPPIPLTPEEERLERETDNDPKIRAYWEKLEKQREERFALHEDDLGG